MFRKSRSFAVAFLLAAGLSATCSAGPMPTPGAATPFMLGKLNLVSLRDAQFQAPNDGKTFGVDVGPAAVAAALKQGGQPSDRITVSVDALLVRLPGRIVLIDSGLGPKAGGSLMASLAIAGIKPDAITDVLITHTHGDHIGGVATADGRLAFPHATIRMSVKEWAWMQSQPGSKALATLIAPRVAPFRPGSEVVPAITSLAIAGHTPGHVGYEIRSGGAQLLDIGDTAHSSLLSLADPQWTMGFDENGTLGKASRIAMLKRLSASHELIFAPHFPYPGVGRIVAAGPAFAWAPGVPR